MPICYDCYCPSGEAHPKLSPRREIRREGQPLCRRLFPNLQRVWPAGASPLLSPKHTHNVDSVFSVTETGQW